MGKCCSSSSSADYSVTTASCPACGLQQEVPERALYLACRHCRAAIVGFARRRGVLQTVCTSLGLKDLVGNAHSTVWSVKRPKVGAVVKLTPCCLYYDHTCIELGPLKGPGDEGRVVGGGADDPSMSRATHLVVEAHGKRFGYRMGCVEETSALRCHHELFSKFATMADADNACGAVMGFAEFSDYVSTTTGESATWDMYECICRTLVVHPSQGLTSGDFRRMYCEFDGDLQEDHRIACGLSVKSDNSAPTVLPPDPGEPPSASRCKACVEREADVVFVPCAHRGLCEACALPVGVGAAAVQCPVCQTAIKSVEKIDARRAHDATTPADVKISTTDDVDTKT
mmetsp:Transcript_93138/g.263014  ORF Transcript_93138/g.263014 Transcript_93138/m.263014 type:complete len:342 (-) Transcript_93138:52-1077(-)